MIPSRVLKGADLVQWEDLLEKAGDERKAWEAWQRWKCRTDLYYLGTEVLEWGKIRHHGKSLIDPVFHRWMCRILEPRENLLLLVPRWHLKTSFIKLRIVQEIITNPYVRIGLLSLTGGRSRMSVKGIIRIMADPRLRRIFPDLIPVPGRKFTGWQEASQDALTVYRPTKEGSMPEEPQLSAYGVDSTYTGLHFDWWIGDDILNQDTVRTPSLMEKTEEWYHHARGVLDPFGWETYLGTHYHHNDLYTKIRNDGDVKRVFVRGATDAPAPAPGQPVRGKPIYRMFTTDLLEKYRRRMTNWVFSCQMFNDPSPMQDRLFPSPQPTYDFLPEGKYRYYITVDPAATTRVYSDETAIVVTALARNLIVYVVEALHFKKSGDEIARIILDLNEKYHPETVGIELGLQEHLLVIINMIRDQYERANQKKVMLPMVSVKIDHTKTKYDRISRTLGGLVRAGKVQIHESLRDLMTQMEFITPNYRGKDDLVDALSMAFTIIKPYGSAWRSSVELTKVGWASMDEIMKKKPQGTWKARIAV